MDLLKEASETLFPCTVCGYLDPQNPCSICTDPKRDDSLLCIVSQITDVWAVEKTGQFNGRYHILGGTLSALEGIGPEELRLDSLKSRVVASIKGNTPIEEAVLALPPTLEGQTTGHLALQVLNEAGLGKEHITTLARGVPSGSHLDFLDEETLSAGLKGRKRCA